MGFTAILTVVFLWAKFRKISFFYYLLFLLFFTLEIAKNIIVFYVYVNTPLGLPAFLPWINMSLRISHFGWIVIIPVLSFTILKKKQNLLLLFLSILIAAILFPFGDYKLKVMDSNFIMLMTSTPSAFTYSYIIILLEFSILFIWLVKHSKEIENREIRKLIQTGLIMFFISLPALLYQILTPWGFLSRFQKSITEFIGLTAILFTYFFWNLAGVILTGMYFIRQASSIIISETGISEISSRFGLTSREKDVAALLIKRYSYKEIGTELFISIKTVKSHVHNIYQKMYAEGRGDFNRIINEAGINKA